MKEICQVLIRIEDVLLIHFTSEKRRTAAAEAEKKTTLKNDEACLIVSSLHQLFCLMVLTKRLKNKKVQYYFL